MKFDPTLTYFYKYETSSLLWISDVSDEAKSNLQLSATVILKPKDKCVFTMRLSDVRISGDSLTDTEKIAAVKQLGSDFTRFTLNKNGELSTQVRFGPAETAWSRNVKRGVISVLQVKSQDDLRKADEMDASSEKSAVVYENDVLGRCRTTYKLESASADSYKLKKTKSLGRCTLNENSKSSPIQFVPYKNLPVSCPFPLPNSSFPAGFSNFPFIQEFFHGKLFNENYECESLVEKGLIKSVKCEETSTYKIGSRGTSGVQAVIEQKLTYESTGPRDRMGDRKHLFPLLLLREQFAEAA